MRFGDGIGIPACLPLSQETQSAILSRLDSGYPGGQEVELNRLATGRSLNPRVKPSRRIQKKTAPRVWERRFLIVCRNYSTEFFFGKTHLFNWRDRATKSLYKSMNRPLTPSNRNFALCFETDPAAIHVSTNPDRYDDARHVAAFAEPFTRKSKDPDHRPPHRDLSRHQPARAASHSIGWTRPQCVLFGLAIGRSRRHGSCSSFPKQMFPDIDGVPRAA